MTLYFNKNTLLLHLYLHNTFKPFKYIDTQYVPLNSINHKVQLAQSSHPSESVCFGGQPAYKMCDEDFVVKMTQKCVAKKLFYPYTHHPFEALTLKVNFLNR